MQEIKKLGPKQAGRPKRAVKARTAEPIVDKPLEAATIEGMARMMDPVLVIGEVDPPTAAQAQAASFHNYIREHIETLQRHLRPGEELFVYVHTGYEIIRVLNMAMPDWHIVVLTGLDADDNPAQLVTYMRQIRFVCKIMRVPAEHKHNPIGFKFPTESAAEPA